MIKIKNVLISEIPWRMEGKYGSFVCYDRRGALELREGLQKIINQIDREGNKKWRKK